MDDRDKTYLLKELTKTIDGSDSTAAFCLCQRWILKDALVMLKEQEREIKRLKLELKEQEPRILDWDEMPMEERKTGGEV